MALEVQQIKFNLSGILEISFIFNLLSPSKENLRRSYYLNINESVEKYQNSVHKL